MDHADHVALLRAGIPGPGGVWADLGSGDGAFTLALADLLGAAARIISVDKDARALRRQEQAMRTRFATAQVTYVVANFTRRLALPPLDGIVMANSLHFVRAKAPVLAQVRGYLRPGGRLLIVEYNADRGNVWVPYPFSFATWERLAAQAGLRETRLLATRPSRFLREIYAAMSVA